MISNCIKTRTASFVSTAKMTDRSIVSACSLGLSGSAFLGSGLPVTGLSGLGMPAIERNERPTKALEAVAAGKAKAFAFAATGAGVEQRQKTTYHHTMWAFRGLEPWSDPV